MDEGTKYTSENVTPHFCFDLRILAQVHVFSQETSATSGFTLGSICGIVFHVSQSWLKNGTWELTMANQVKSSKRTVKQR